MEGQKERKGSVATASERRRGAVSRRTPTKRHAGSASRGASGVAEEPALLEVATSVSRRGRGLLLSQPGDAALLLVPCSDVHTAGMAHRIDVAFVDGEGGVMASYRDVGPFRRLRCKGAAAVIERFSSCGTPWFEPGDRVGVVPMKEER